MTTITISPKFQIVIPKIVRESLGLKSGERMQVIPYRSRIELIPLKPMRRLRGFLKGIDTELPREGDRL